MAGGARFGAGLSTSDDPRTAAGEACAAAAEGLGGAGATLVALFASPGLCDDAETLLEVAHSSLAPERLIGCMGEAVVGRGREVEGAPGVAVWAAHLPGVELVPFRLVARPLEEGLGVLGWPDSVGAGPEGAEGPVLLIVDPFTFPADGLLAELNTEAAAPPVIGGLASGGHRPGDHVLLADSDVLTEGAVGLAIRGAHVRTVVSQGCRPIGPEMVITESDGSMVHELAGMSAVEKLQEVVSGLDAEERALASEGLLAGLVIDENVPEYGRGDFLVRGIHGTDRESGALVVGEQVRVGQTMRFHVRDAASADEDLRAALHAARADLGGRGAAGALLFTCNGRGTRMFDAPDHDAAALARELGGVPAAGVFCNGEIGPVGGRSFLHGFTATMALFGDGGE